jgi:hypothetical protein
VRTDNGRTFPLTGDAAVIARAIALSLTMTLGLASAPLFAQGDKKGETKEPDLAELKKQRDLADAMMRKVTEQALKNLDKAAKDTKDDKTAQAIREGLQKRMASKRYFGTGTSQDELAAFQSGLKEADQAGIKIGGEALNELIRSSVYQRVSDKEIKSLAQEVGKQNGNATADNVLRAVAAEFRARIAVELKDKKK